MDKKKILLIEDDKFTRELYEEILKDAGFIAESAINGEEGLEMIKSSTAYDLILLDVMMPKMDGIEVLRSIKNDPPERPIAPIVLLTNLTNDPVFNTAYGLNVGVRDHVVKSDITPGDLVEKIKGYLKGNFGPTQI